MFLRNLDFTENISFFKGFSSIRNVAEGSCTVVALEALARVALQALAIKLCLPFSVPARSHANCPSAPCALPLPTYLNLFGLFCVMNIPEMAGVQRLGGCVVMNPHIGGEVVCFCQHGNRRYTVSQAV